MPSIQNAGMACAVLYIRPPDQKPMYRLCLGLNHDFTSTAYFDDTSHGY
jgi:hypothetical protein